MRKDKIAYILIPASILFICLQSFIFAQQNEFYFVQITDTHWGSNNNVQRTKAIIDSINMLPMAIEFVAHTGDLTAETIENKPLMDSVKAMMRACKYPVFYCPGNHDIAWKRFPETSEAFMKHFGSLSSSREVRGVSIINLFNFIVQSFSSPALLNDPLQKLDSLLSGKPVEKPAILFQHDPTVEDFYNKAFHPGWPQERMEKFQKMCEKNNVIAVISGHFHRDELHWLGQIPLYVSAPVAAKKGRQSTFRVYHYENGKISYFTQYQ